MRRARILIVALSLILAGTLTACGGGGGGGDDTGSSNWDEMVWNDSTWGPAAP